MNRSVVVCALLVLMSTLAAFGAAVPVSADKTDPGSANGPALMAVNGPTPNPYLAAPLYAITHFDPSASDSIPYGPPPGVFVVDPGNQAVCPGGPTSIMTLASNDPNYMWQVSSDRVAYVRKEGGKWSTVAKFEILANASGGVYPEIPDATFRDFGEASAVGKTVSSMDSYLKGLFGDNYAGRFGQGVYTLVDSRNVLYANYFGNLYGFTLNDQADPGSGITVACELSNVVSAIEGPSASAILVGLSMTYDGYLIVTFTNGVAVIDRDLALQVKSFYPFGPGEMVTNSLSVDNGIYVASNLLMRKLVWTGTTLSDAASDGAWSSAYDNSGSALPPVIKAMNDTGSTPTLMGFGNDPDKLVVITDGAKQMKLVAFWRDAIPLGFTGRIAGQIQVTCGFDPLPEWIQTEQSVVVKGYGAFVVNNIPREVPAELTAAPRLLQVSLMGPAYTGSYGVERFQWDHVMHNWSSVWGRSDVSSTSMVPIHSESGKMAVINGYRPDRGWEVLGMDWDTGKTVHQTIFGHKNFGNGAYALLQYLENGDLVFNSIAGPFRVHYNRGLGCEINLLLLD